MFYVNKWHVFGVSALLQCAAGASYCFAIYAGVLKEALGLTQAQIQGAASPLFVTLALQWLPGAVYDSLVPWPRLGPRATLGTGLAAMMCGYGGLWLAASGRAAPPYWALVGLTAAAFAGGSWVDTACIATNVRNFPGHRGTVVGVLKSFAGLSASVFTAVYLAAFRPDAAAFLACLAAAPALLAAVALPLFNAVPFLQDACAEAPRVAGARFAVAQNVVLMLAAYAVGAGALGAALPGPLPGWVSAALLAGLAALLLPLPLLALGTGGVAARPAARLGLGLEPGVDGISRLAGCVAVCGKGALQECGGGVQGARRGAGADELVNGGACGVPGAAGGGDAHSAAAKAAPSGVVTVWAGADDDARAPLLGSCKGEAHGLAITASGCLPPLQDGAAPTPAAVQHALVPHLPTWADASGQATTAPVHGPVWSDARLALAPAELTLVQCAASPDYWLLFGVLGAGTGCGLLFSNNLGQLVQALGGASDGQAALVSLFSVASAAGRLAAGHLPERALHAWRTPRPAYLIAAAALTAAAMTLAACADLRLLWLVAPLSGFAYGCHWSLGPALSSELFGLRRFATLYCLLNYSTTLGAYLLAMRLAGTLYQQVAARHGDPDSVCLGVDCFRGTFLAAAALELGVAGLAALLFWRTRRRYSGPLILADLQLPGAAV